MSAAALDRQIKPIYDALDTGSNKSAIVGCNKLLKKHPKNILLKSLKALALIRSQKVEESLALCDEVLESKPTDDDVLTAMMHVLRGLGRHNDMVMMFEEAYKKQPGNEDLGAQTFFANVRASHWKSAHNVASRMYKHFQEDRYLYWSVISAVLQAKDVATPQAMRPILFKLAHRLLTSSPTPSYAKADRFHLHLSLLRELELYDEAEQLLESDIGKNICATSLSCDEIRGDIWYRQGRTQQESDRAERLIVDKKDRNWLEFLSVLDATLPRQVSSSHSEQSRQDMEAKIIHSEALFSKIVEEDGLKDRSGFLALLELEKRSAAHGLSKDPSRMVTLMQQYFERFGDKACCFEDLKPYLTMGAEDLVKWTAFLEAVPTSFTTIPELCRLVNSFKILRFSLLESDITAEMELTRVDKYLKYYLEALPLGANLPSTELQPADDLALLAGNTLVNLWTLTHHDVHLLNAVYLLEYGLTKSKQSFLMRLILIRIYQILGAPSSALEHYRSMRIKQVQHDTLSHLILARASTFSLAATGDLTLASECLESTQIYLSNSQETGDFVVRAFTAEKYSQIPEFIEFEERLDNSLQRDTVKMEHLRMRLTHELISSDIIDMELIELKFIFDRTHHDNRDFAIFPNYQPHICKGLHEQTLLFGKPEGHAWLSTYLKVYIRAFQQASDLDDTVEEKLLIGDRPKQTANFDKKLSWKERLLERNPDDLAPLTSDEIKFIEYADALADWLEPYHDYSRPPPAVVLAEAAKQTELKTGHPLKGIDVQPSNGTNGHKKDESPPTIQEPPVLVVKYFETLQLRFDEINEKASPSEILHLATVAQESFLLLIVEITRFKNPVVVKTNKLGALVPSIKELQVAALSVLKNISAALTKRGDLEGSAARRKAISDSCLDNIASQDFTFNHAKNITDSRRKVLEGVAKGIARICTIYAS